MDEPKLTFSFGVESEKKNVLEWKVFQFLKDQHGVAEESVRACQVHFDSIEVEDHQEAKTRYKLPFQVQSAFFDVASNPLNRYERKVQVL